jgi:hypothetical protein
MMIAITLVVVIVVVENALLVEMAVVALEAVLDVVKAVGVEEDMALQEKY